MRRLGLLAMIVLSAAGCAALRDAFTAHPDVAARAAGVELPTRRLTQLALQVKGMPLEQRNLQALVDLWVDYQLFAHSLAAGRDLDDSATMRAAMWPEISQLRWGHYHERLAAAHGTLTPQQVDSIYNAGYERAFQHILLEVPPNATPAQVAQKQRLIQSILAQARAAHGANFAALARRYSEDGTKSRGGYLGVSTRGKYVPQFEEPAWKLAPGEMSDVVRSPFGFHVIRRPPLAEIRDSFQADLEGEMNRTLDSAYAANLALSKHVRVGSNAVAEARAAATDLNGSINDGRVLVDYDGGGFRVRDLVRWLYALNPQISAAVVDTSTPPDQVNQLLRLLAQRQLLLQQADSAGVRLTADDWAGVKEDYDSSLARLEGALKISPALFRDSVKTDSARGAVAAQRIDAYLDALVSGQTGFAAVPPFLAQELRARGSWSIMEAGVQRSLKDAQAQRAAERPESNGAPPPAITPAPGPAPTPGGARPPR